MTLTLVGCHSGGPGNHSTVPPSPKLAAFDTLISGLLERHPAAASLRLFSLHAPCDGTYRCYDVTKDKQTGKSTDFLPQQTGKNTAFPPQQSILMSVIGQAFEAVRAVID